MARLAPGAEDVDHADWPERRSAVGKARPAPSRPGRSIGGTGLPIRTEGMLDGSPAPEALEQEPGERHEDDERRIGEPPSPRRAPAAGSASLLTGSRREPRRARRRAPVSPHPVAPQTASVSTTQPIMATIVAAAGIGRDDEAEMGVAHRASGPPRRPVRRKPVALDGGEHRQRGRCAGAGSRCGSPSDAA